MTAAIPSMPYQPEAMTLEQAVSKICTFEEDFPEVKVYRACFNRNGVGVFGWYDLTAANVFFWGGPQCAQVERIRSARCDANRNGECFANSYHVAPRFDFNERNVRNPSTLELTTEYSYKLGGEEAVPFSFNDPQVQALIKAAKPLRRQQEQAETQKSGVVIEDRTNGIARVVLLSDESSRCKYNVFRVTVQGKRLIFPVSEWSVGTRCNNLRFSQNGFTNMKFCFEMATEHLIKMTVELQKSEKEKITDTLYVDTSKVRDGLAIDVQHHLREPITPETAIAQIANSSIPSLNGIVRAACNCHGTVLIVQDIITKIWSFFYGTPQAKSLTPINGKWENFKKSEEAFNWDMRSLDSFVRYENRYSYTTKDSTLFLNGEQAVSLEDKIQKLVKEKTLEAIKEGIPDLPSALAPLIAS